MTADPLANGMFAPALATTHATRTSPLDRTTPSEFAGLDPRPGGAPPTSPPVAQPPVGAPVQQVRRAKSRLAEFGESLLWAGIGIGVFVLLWQIGSMVAQELPSPAETFGALKFLLSYPLYDTPNDKGILRYLGLSLFRVFVAFSLAAAVGIPLGLLIGANARAWQAFNPVVQILRPVSPLAWFPLWLAATRSGPTAVYVVIFITALWPILINTAAGAAAIPNDHRNVARVFQFGRVAYLRHVLLPNALPSVITGLRLSMGIAWMVIVAVEMLSGSAGIGFFTWDTYNAGNTANVAAAIILIGVTGLILDAILMRLSRMVAIEEVKA
jgi:nitrate/nitrite transport system permease protein